MTDAASAPAAAAPSPRAGDADFPVPAISVVVPMRNEGPNVAALLAEIAAALRGVPHESVCIDDGSADDTAARLLEAAAAAPPGARVRLLRHERSCGQSAAIVSGVRAARASWIATLDGDGQNDPADIPRLWARARAENAAGAAPATAANAALGAASAPIPVPALVSGWRTQRRDSWIKRRSSRVANAVRSRLLGDSTPDTGCGLKVFPRALFLELPAFDHMHRFLPALVIRAGGRVVSEPVNHRPRLRGASNYGTLDRLAVGLVDLVGVAWLQRRWRRPRVAEAAVPVAAPVQGPAQVPTQIPAHAPTHAPAHAPIGGDG